ncbi:MULTISPECIES: hypothetical protein [Thermoactinomyces]|uniref:Uncharacterized protein n=1 Tax=Thermoactinomyces daqus TaxID=1329516 RepID=A0A7W2AHH7_9BACL|nr:MULTISPECIES: hypothetical protein [Thermoactinomyces]MBA4542716.1 hypothetical protein [Thermoactinomyces daqus]MBH8607286.1 hypothetical protein [Thermoactinomyces sp. CICC 10521]
MKKVLIWIGAFLGLCILMAILPGLLVLISLAAVVVGIISIKGKISSPKWLVSLAKYPIALIAFGALFFLISVASLGANDAKPVVKPTPVGKTPIAIKEPVQPDPPDGRLTSDLINTL